MGAMLNSGSQMEPLSRLPGILDGSSQPLRFQTLRCPLYRTTTFDHMVYAM